MSTNPGFDPHHGKREKNVCYKLTTSHTSYKRQLKSEIYHFFSNYKKNYWSFKHKVDYKTFMGSELEGEDRIQGLAGQSV